MSAVSARKPAEKPTDLESKKAREAYEYDIALL